jgi:superfamily II DNA or RNA helicase
LEFSRGGKDVKVLQSENGAYTFLEENYQKWFRTFQYNEAQKNTLQMMDEDATHYEEAAKKAFALMKVWSNRRKMFLHNLESSVKVARKVLHKFLTESDRNKALIFSALNAQSEKVSPYTFNTATESEDNLTKFNEGTIPILGVSKKINRGVNLNGVNGIMYESYVGSETDFQQRHGRGVRLDPDQTMYFMVLVPYYWVKKEIEKEGKKEDMWYKVPTQAQTWVNKMTASFDYDPVIVDMVHDARSDRYSIPPEHDNIFKSS